LGVLVARAAALSADQQHIARHLDTDHRASACSAQEGRELLAADEVFGASSRTRSSWIGKPARWIVTPPNI
jgi:hypothetical protein